ncbi:MAG: hypothetical protein HYV07_06545 [Deltaproteobacteria bacterium]|nr:hypothetical protein [Deltaproteobacteria bacterium]
MARRRSGRGGGGGGRSKAHRAPTFRATCRGCGKTEQMPVRPPANIDLYCQDCITKGVRPAVGA